MKNGSKNLLLLGCIAIFIALLTTGISLAVYHDSGDIYLDRSRPGFLPDEKELEKNEDNFSYTFSETGGEITDEEIEEYVDSLNVFKEKLNAVPNPFSLDSISDDSLGISE